MSYFNKSKIFENNTQSYHQLESNQCSCETIVMQEMPYNSIYGGIANHVYPSNNILPMCAFQNMPSPSHTFLPKSTVSTTKSQKEMSSPFHRMHLSSAPGTGNLSRRYTVQETSFMNKLNNDAVVQKIHNIFPTASEDHIRLLLKKYYNSEAVVISALQVEKYPVTMPGPFVTPPSQRHLFPNDSSTQITATFCQNYNLRSQHSLPLYDSYSRTNSPLLQPYHHIDGIKIANSKNSNVDSTIIPGYYRTPCYKSYSKPHSSPKMKLRYLKTIFPKMDETILLDILANAENNVQKATDTLTSQGFMKHVLPAIIATDNQNQNQDNQQQVSPLNNTDNRRHQLTKIISLHPAQYTEDEKISTKCSLKEKYPLIADDIILMALETVNYSEERASQILQVALQEEKHRKSPNLNRDVKSSNSEGDRNTFINQDLRISSTHKITETQTPDPSNEGMCGEIKFSIRSIKAKGPNKDFAKGPNECLLLADYVTWNGANPEFLQVHDKLQIGPNLKLLSKPKYQPCGHNSKLCEGHQPNLAKGSIYAKHNS